MAYDDALFQLGMDLTRSSTAQKEDLFDDVPASREGDTESPSAGFHGSCTSGQNIILDLIGAQRLSSVRAVEKALRQAFALARAELCLLSSERQASGGRLQATARLAEGALEVVVWPRTGYVAIDLKGSSLRPELVMTALADAFGAREVIIRRSRPASLLARYAKEAPASAPARVADVRRSSVRTMKQARAA